MEIIKWIFTFVFGSNKKQIFKRVLIVLIIIILSQCVSFGFDKKGNFYFQFAPFVKITKEL